MSIVSRRDLPRFVQLGRAETLTHPLTDETGATVEVTGATFTLLDAESTTVETGSATITAGVASYALPGTFSDGYTAPQEPWRERWELAGIASPHPATQTLEHEVLFCRIAPVQHVDLESLYQMHPQWREQIRRSRKAGASQDPVALAWSEMCRRLLGDGLLPHRILNWWAFAEVHRYWAAHLVASDFAADAPDASRWERRAEQYWDRSQSEYERLSRVILDRDEDGLPEVEGATSSITLGPSPRDWRW